MFVSDSEIKSFTSESARFYQSTLKRIARIFLVFNRLEFMGLENKIPSGPNIVISNHPAAVKEMISPAKDIAAIYMAYDAPPNRRQVNFLATSELFEKNTFVKTISKHLAPIFQIILNPAIRSFVNYAIPRIKAIGTIPVYSSEIKGRKETRAKIEEYLLKGRAVVFLQSNFLHQSRIHPYLKKFRKGAAFIAYDIYQKYKMNIPVTPISIYGTEGFIRPFKKIRVSIGKSLFIEPFLKDKSPVRGFTDTLEEKVKDLLEESVGLRSLDRN